MLPARYNDTYLHRILRVMVRSRLGRLICYLAMVRPLGIFDCVASCHGHLNHCLTRIIFLTESKNQFLSRKLFTADLYYLYFVRSHNRCADQNVRPSLMR